MPYIALGDWLPPCSFQGARYLPIPGGRSDKKHKKEQKMEKQIKLWVVSGEGAGEGHSRLISSRSLRGVRRILTLERCGGDRWAHLAIETPTMQWIAIDEETLIKQGILI